MELLLILAFVALGWVGVKAAQVYDAISGKGTSRPSGSKPSSPSTGPKPRAGGEPSGGKSSPGKAGNGKPKPGKTPSASPGRKTTPQGKRRRLRLPRWKWPKRRRATSPGPFPASPAPPPPSPTPSPSPSRVSPSPSRVSPSPSPPRPRNPASGTTTHSAPEKPMTTAPAPTTPAENVPQHMTNGDAFHGSLDSLADTLDQHAQAMRTHVEAAEALQIEGDVLGQWTDAADHLSQAAGLVRASAEAAAVAARTERERLSPLVEAAAGAPMGAGATVGTLRD